MTTPPEWVYRSSGVSGGRMTTACIAYPGVLLIPVSLTEILNIFILSDVIGGSLLLELA